MTGPSTPSTPDRLSYVMDELVEIKALLATVLASAEREPAPREYLTVDEAAEFLGAAKSYIYRLTHEKRIPYAKPSGGRVLIKRQDLLTWIASSRVRSDGEVREAAMRSVSRLRRG